MFWLWPQGFLIPQTPFGMTQRGILKSLSGIRGAADPRTLLVKETC
jgi:hypothetical protein